MNHFKHHTPVPRNGPPGPSNTGPVTSTFMSREEIDAKFANIKPAKRQGLVRW